jgi:hypothetical protein
MSRQRARRSGQWICLVGAAALAGLCAASSVQAKPSAAYRGVFGDAAPRELHPQDPLPLWVKALRGYVYPMMLLERAGAPVALLSPTGMGGFGALVLPSGCCYRP